MTLKINESSVLDIENFIIIIIIIKTKYIKNLENIQNNKWI